MTLSKKQKEAVKSHMEWLYIWERDMLQMAKEHYAWRDLANSLGYSDEKIDAPWVHADEGKHIPYMRIADMYHEP